MKNEKFKMKNTKKKKKGPAINRCGYGKDSPGNALPSHVPHLQLHPGVSLNIDGFFQEVYTNSLVERERERVEAGTQGLIYQQTTTKEAV